MKREWIRGLKIFSLLIFCASAGPAAEAAPALPETPTKFWIKDRPYRETVTELFKLTPLKVEFAKGVDVDKTVSIDVQSVKWNTLLLAVIEAYGFQYRFKSADTVEIIKK